MKDKSIIVIVLSCLLFNALFIVLASYQLITGEQESIRVNVDEMKDGLLNQEKTANLLNLPPNQFKSYISSIKFLEKYTDVLEDARDFHKSAGLFILIPTFMSEIVLLLVLTRLRRGWPVVEERRPVT